LLLDTILIDTILIASASYLANPRQSLGSLGGGDIKVTICQYNACAVFCSLYRQVVDGNRKLATVAGQP